MECLYMHRGIFFESWLSEFKADQLKYLSVLIIIKVYLWMFALFKVL